jgi:hypothetical protein
MGRPLRQYQNGVFFYFIFPLLGVFSLALAFAFAFAFGFAVGFFITSEPAAFFALEGFFTLLLGRTGTACGEAIATGRGDTFED